LGQKIKDFILKNFSSIQEFADLLGMKSEQLYPYFNDKVVPSATFLAKLKELGCDINWLLSDSPDPPPETNQLLQARLKELEEENQRLRDSISHILLLAQEVTQQKKGKTKRKK
jgi:transcriptional regulator with XRE-family HTH domain